MKTAAEHAIQTYTVIARSLLIEARQLEKRKQPLSARKVRYWASVVDRAAFAEGVDQEPKVA